MRFRVSIGQINPKSGDLAGNQRMIKEAIRRARDTESHLLVLPEMCLTGYCLDEKLLMNREFLRENKRVLGEEIAPLCDDLAVVVGFVDFEEGRLGPDRHPVRYNAAAVMHRKTIRQVVHKRLLPSYRYFDDKRYFAPGQEVEPLRLEFGGGAVRIGILICEDLWDEKYEGKPAEVYAAKGVDYLLNINASPFVCSSPGKRDGKIFVREELIRRQVEKTGVPLVSVNTVGIGDNGKNVIVFDGSSMAVDAAGRLVARLPSFQEEQKTVDFQDGRAERVEPPVFDREGEIFEALAMGVRDYYDKIGIFNGVLEAVSGGIDSALGTAIAYEAVGPELLTLYNLPSQFNSEQTKSAAKKLAENLDLEYRVVPIQGMVDRVQHDFEEHLHPIEQSITVENLQARIRGLVMMAESNDRGALLLTNGNETEIALGYATLYGDMVGGLAVIGDLPKPDVYRVARYVNRRYEKEVIPTEIFEIPASAELKEDQTDPFDYDVVGPVISELIELGKSPSDLAGEFRRRELNVSKFVSGGEIYEKYDEESFEELVRHLFQLLNRSVYKRMQAAPIIVVSERAFGFDLREAIINGWRG